MMDERIYMEHWWNGIDMAVFLHFTATMLLSHYYETYFTPRFLKNTVLAYNAHLYCRKLCTFQWNLVLQSLELPCK